MRGCFYEENTFNRIGTSYSLEARMIEIIYYTTFFLLQKCVFQVCESK